MTHQYDTDFLGCLGLCTISAPAEVAHSSGISEMETVPGIENAASFKPDEVIPIIPEEEPVADGKRSDVPGGGAPQCAA